MNDSLNDYKIQNKEIRFKSSDRLMGIVRSFSATEKVLLAGLTIVAGFASLYLAWILNSQFLVPVPTNGGTMTEGMVGLPRYVNPVLAQTDTDRDLTALVYAGLMRYKDGKLVPDLASSYTVSPDGLVYTFSIRDNAEFHDGRPVTADDVVFTIQKIQDPDVGSPRRADWSNVSVKALSNKEVEFTIRQPYGPFLSNTVVGIVPKHIWQEVSNEQFIFSQFNLEPVGSGPYYFSDISVDESGIPETYTLKVYRGYHSGASYISRIKVIFYPNERMAGEAFAVGDIDSVASLSPLEVGRVASTTDDYEVSRVALPRIFGIFFNQNRAPVLASKDVRRALNLAVDKEAIVNEVLGGYGVAIDSPIPSTGSSTATSTSTSYDLDLAREILSDAGWVVNQNTGILEKKSSSGTLTLSFDIYTTDTPDLKKATEMVVEYWRMIGASVNVKIFEYGDLYQNIIRPRAYDALLFGEFIGKDLDLYAFWHSSQRNSPGLNLSMYVNQTADKILEDARTTGDEAERDAMYAKLETTIKSDIPAVFLYSPEFIYLTRGVKGIEMQSITIPSDRWYGVSDWYKRTEYIWNIFNAI